jgi:hypothetical protein
MLDLFDYPLPESDPVADIAAIIAAQNTRHEGVVIRDGVVIYRTRPMTRQDWAFAEALDWIAAHDVTDADASTETRHT